MIKKTLLGLLVLILGLFALMAIRASRLPDLQPPAAETVTIAVDGEAVAARFAEALTFPTISHQEEEDRQPEVFLAFHEFLERSFPTVHATLERETVNELSLLYTWEGRDSSLDPVLLMGHQDVVPVIPGTEEDWQQPPFGGVIADGMVWGRGALDDKSSVMSILEAVEMLTAEGFRPQADDLPRLRA